MANGSSKKTTGSKSVAEKSLALVGNTDLCTKDERGREWIELTWNATPEGGEHDDSGMMRLPKVRLLNTNSKELRKDSKVPGAEVGMFYNMVSGELKEEIEVVPLMVYQERYFNFPKGGTQLVCLSLDGKAQYGVCPSGNYQEFGIPTKIMRIEDGPERELGICAQCPKAQRGYGEQSECQYVKNLICFDASMLTKVDEYVQRLKDGDPEVSIELLNGLFFLPFQSTKLKALNLVTQQSMHDQMYFGWTWLFRSTTDSNQYGEWQTYNPVRRTKLTPDQVVFARSLFKFAQKVRPVITDFEDTGIAVEVEFTETAGLEE